MLTKLTIEEIRKGINQKEFTYSDILDAYEKNYIAQRVLNVDISEYWDQAKKQAKDLDKNPNAEQKPLDGILIAVKDMFLVNGTKTTAASKILENFVAPYESFTTSKLKQDGYIMPFKTNLDEFAMGSSGQTSAFGATINPWILSDRVLRVPGGSSSGSASAVAASMCLGATGTDTGGSIRQPASFCGIVGIKPTYGRCSRRGVVAFASSLDHPGVFARTVQDACIILESMAGYDELEATSLNASVPKLSSTLPTVKNKKIGIVSQEFDHMHPEYKASIKNLLENLKNEGAIIEEVQMPSFETALKLYYIIAPAEAASNLSRYDGIVYGSRGAGSEYDQILHGTRNNFGDEVKRRILVGNFVLYADEYDKFFGKAIKIRAQIRAQMDALFANFDAVLLPTTASVAFPIGQKRSAIEMYREDLYTILANIYGGPAMSLPLCAVSVESATEGKKADTSFDCLKSQEKLPMGLQIMAKREDEIQMIEVAKKIEQIVGWKGLGNV